MSGLATILHTRGFAVTGSDQTASALTEELESRGIPVAIGQRAENIPENTALIVYTAAIHPDNPEFAEAVRRGIPMLSRADLLGQIMRNYRTAVAVAGTHGKTTTTGMLTEIFVAADLDPTVSIGGNLPSIGGNLRIGNSPTFLTEACEYTNSFLSFFPTIGVILNVEEDHLDFFKDLSDIASSFHRFAKLLPEDGTLVIGTNTNCFETITENLTCRVITAGTDPSSAITAQSISYDPMGHATFKCIAFGEEFGTVTLRVPGKHNVENALAAIGAALAAGADREAILAGLSSYAGTERRFEYKGKLGSVPLIDDYAHHPTEIRATLSAASALPHERIVVAFQSHTYTRTAALLPDFADALSAADLVVLPDIYAAREKNTIGISADDLRAAIEAKGTEAHYRPTYEETEAFLREALRPGDILITMGAGPVFRVGESLLKSGFHVEN